MSSRGAKIRKIIVLVVNSKLLFDVIEESSHNAGSGFIVFYDAINQ